MCRTTWQMYYSQWYEEIRPDLIVALVLRLPDQRDAGVRTVLRRDVPAFLFPGAERPLEKASPLMGSSSEKGEAHTIIRSACRYRHASGHEKNLPADRQRDARDVLHSSPTDP